MIRAVKVATPKPYKQSLSEAYKQHLYSHRFYQILYENLSNKIIKASNNIEAHLTCKILIFGYVVEIAKTDLIFTNEREIDINKIDSSFDTKPIFDVDCNIQISTSFKSVGLNGWSHIQKSTKLLIWLMEDNYVCICEYTEHRDGFHKHNYNVLELSEFMKALKNPFELL
jgi:hypothetical protein